MITEEQFDSWRHDPITKEIFKLLELKREELRQQWEGGSFSDYSKDTTVLVNVGNLGTCRGYAYVTSLTYETLATELEYQIEEKKDGK